MSSLRRFGAALLGALSLALLLGSQSAHAQTTFSNAAPIAIIDGSGGAAGNPYPSNINVSGLPGSVSKVTVRLNGFTHSFPTDVDLLLVGPNGQGVMLMSDAGGSQAVAEMNVTFDDAAGQDVPADGPIETATYRPTDYEGFGSEEFPPPAPAGPYATTLSAFNGINPNGTWSLYVVDDQQGDAGQISGGWSIIVTMPPTPVNAGDVVISEFRSRGPAGSDDEYVEVANRTDFPILVGTTDGSEGWAVVSSDGVTRFVVPNGTVLPSKAHYLGVNSGGYGLSGHPAGVNRTAKGDATFTGDMPDAVGLALFRTSNPASFTLENRLDAAGFAGVTNELYREGAGLSPATGITENADHAFARRLVANVLHADSANNEADFWFVSTSAATLSGRASVLGSPGPENLSSPLAQYPSAVGLVITDPAVPASAAPNRVRDTTPSLSAPLGTLAVRRTVVNYTGQPITRLRFRITDLTTKGNGGGLNGVADLRAVTAPSVKATLADGRVVKIVGAVLEEPAAHLDGGAFNSTLGITLDQPIPPGGTVNVQFFLAVNVSGSYRFYINTETLH